MDHSSLTPVESKAKIRSKMPKNLKLDSFAAKMQSGELKKTIQGRILLNSGL